MHYVTLESLSESFGLQVHAICLGSNPHLEGSFRIPVDSLAQWVCAASCSFRATLTQLYVRSAGIK